MHYVYLATDHRGESWPMLSSGPRTPSPASTTCFELHTVTENQVTAWEAWEALLDQAQERDWRTQP